MDRLGGWILGAVAGMTISNGYLADWNRTHLFNPAWPPHAKFHDAWTVPMGTALGGERPEFPAQKGRGNRRSSPGAVLGRPGRELRLSEHGRAG